jgi:hypothetical protein
LIPLRRSRPNRRRRLTIGEKSIFWKRSKNEGGDGTDAYMREGTTWRVVAADRPYDEFYDFYSVSPEYFEYTLVYEQQLCPYQMLFFFCRTCASFTRKMHSATAVNCVQEHKVQGIFFQIPFRGSTDSYMPLSCLNQYNFPTLSNNSEISSGHNLLEIMVPTWIISFFFLKMTEVINFYFSFDILLRQFMCVQNCTGRENSLF